MPRLTYNFRGFIVPVFTPFDENQKLKCDVIPAYAKYLVERGIEGVLVNGTSGEGPSMSVVERKLIASAWMEAARSTRLHVMIQVGGAPYPDVLELAHHAEEIGADSLLCLPELYFKPADNHQLVDYLRYVSEAAPKTPLLYYHIPMFTAVDLHMGRFLETVGNEIPTFVGIKFTSSNLEEASQALQADLGRFTIFLGNDQLISAACTLGMNSFIATSVNIFPELALQIIKANEDGDINRMKKKQQQLSEAVVAISKHGHWVQTMKTAMNMVTSVNVGPPRKPLTKLSAEKVVSMDKQLSSLIHKFK